MDNHATSIRNILLVLLIIAVFAVLKALSGLLLPLTMAALLTILNLPLVNFLHSRRVPRIVVTLLVAILTLVVLWAVFSMISGAMEQLIHEREFLAGQLNKKVDAAVLWVGQAVPGVNVQMIREGLNNVLAPSNVASFIGGVLGSLGSFGSSTILFLVYYLIFLSGATGYHEYVNYVAGSGKDGGTREVWDLTVQSISAYMGIKTIIGLITGICAGLICWLFGLQFPFFWGFMAFLLNYIPSIGSLVATVLPVFMAIIQFESFGVVVGLLASLGTVQFLIGSILDPMIMGNRLRLNTVTIIFGLLFWGYIWGVPGMLLSVPLMVLIRLLLERSEELAVIARIMGNPKSQQEGSKEPLMTKIVSSRGDDD